MDMCLRIVWVGDTFNLYLKDTSVNTIKSYMGNHGYPDGVANYTESVYLDNPSRDWTYSGGAGKRMSRTGDSYFD